MIRKLLLAAAAALVLGGCATGYGYSGHGGYSYDAYGDYYYDDGYGYGGYGAPYGMYRGGGYYGGLYGGYGYPWYGGSSWYGWPGYGYYPPYRPPHRPPHQGRPGLDPPPPSVDPPGNSQARGPVQDWRTRTRAATPTAGRLGAPAPSEAAPPRMRQRPVQRPSVNSGPARLGAPAVRSQGPEAAPARRAPARAAAPRAVEARQAPAARPAMRAPVREAPARSRARVDRTDTP